MSPNLARGIFIAGTVPFIALGIAHWSYTFMDMRQPRKLTPRDDSVRVAMQATSPRITNATTMWQAWLGFNHSHSLGAIFFGLIYLILTLQDFTALAANTPLMVLSVAVPLIYLWIGTRFWFRTPIVGIAIGAACMLAAFVLTR